MNIEELKRILKEKKVIFGTENTLKFLKNNEIEMVLLSNDCKPGLIEDIKKISPKTTVIETGMSKEQLKEPCDEHFNISVIGVIGAGAASGKKKKSKEKKNG